MEIVAIDLKINDGLFSQSIHLGHIGLLDKPMNRTIGLMINITESIQTEKGLQLKLDTIEVKQIIPSKKGGGNLEFRKMVPENELKN